MQSIFDNGKIASIKHKIDFTSPSNTYQINPCQFMRTKNTFKPNWLIRRINDASKIQRNGFEFYCDHKNS